jgi:hypothetical protein
MARGKYNNKNRNHRSRDSYRPAPGSDSTLVANNGSPGSSASSKSLPNLNTYLDGEGNKAQELEASFREASSTLTNTLPPMDPEFNDEYKIKLRKLCEEFEYVDRIWEITRKKPGENETARNSRWHDNFQKRNPGLSQEENCKAFVEEANLAQKVYERSKVLPYNAPIRNTFFKVLFGQQCHSKILKNLLNGLIDDVDKYRESLLKQEVATKSTMDANNAEKNQHTDVGSRRGSRSSKKTKKRVGKGLLGCSPPQTPASRTSAPPQAPLSPSPERIKKRKGESLLGCSPPQTSPQTPPQTPPQAPPQTPPQTPVATLLSLIAKPASEWQWTPLQSPRPETPGPETSSPKTSSPEISSPETSSPETSPSKTAPLKSPLKIPKLRKVEKIKLIDPCIQPLSYIMPLTIPDIRFIDQDGWHNLVEIYAAMCFVEQAARPEFAGLSLDKDGRGAAEQNLYQKLKPVRVFIFTHFRYPRGSKSSTSYCFILNQMDGTPFIEGFEFIIVDLSRFHKTVDELETELDCWCFFLKGLAKECEEEFLKIIKRNPRLQPLLKAYKIWKKYFADPENRKKAVATSMEDIEFSDVLATKAFEINETHLKLMGSIQEDVVKGKAEIARGQIEMDRREAQIEAKLARGNAELEYKQAQIRDGLIKIQAEFERREAQAKAEAQAQTKADMVKRMFLQGLGSDAIANITGLSTDNIAILKESIRV